jgi:hypothetical protein
MPQKFDEHLAYWTAGKHAFKYGRKKGLSSEEILEVNTLIYEVMYEYFVENGKRRVGNRSRSSKDSLGKNV